MKYWRSFLTILLFGVFGIGAVIMNFLIFPVAKLFLNEDKFILFCSDFIHNIWRFFVWLLVLLRIIKLDIKNRQEIEGIRNKVIVSTHPSFIDVVILISLIPRTTCFAKRALAHNPILNNIIKSIFITDDVEIEELKSKNDLFSNFILYHYYLNQKNKSKAAEYKLLLDGKMPSRLLLPFEVIDKKYSVGVPLSQPHIEEDEFIVYKRLGLAGDGYSASTRIMAYYRFGSHDDERKAKYLRNIWAYISSKFGYKGCEGVLKFHWKDSIENLFNEIVELEIIGENEFEYDYVMYNYYKFKKDEVNEKKYAERLIKRDVDRRLIL